jgi:hypothetical protein
VRLSELKVDAKKESEGVWVDVAEGLRLLVASGDSQAYRKYRNKLLKPYLHRVRSRTMSVEDMEKVTRQAMARHVLLGWENLDDDEGNPIPYSREKALEILTESREVFNIVGDFANDQAMFRADLQEDAGKNS